MKRLIKQIEEYEYISLDMFDTLIKRNVNNPKDIFTLMELNYQNKPFNPIHHFCEKRVLAEQKARELATNEEITFDAIYEQLTDIYNQEMVTDLKKLEIQMELDVCVANHAMVDLYNYCIKHNKKIYIISDMYLPKHILSEILHKNGFHRYENLYVSSEVGVQKASGNLFKHVLKDINIKNKQLIHIGDGKKGDFIQPRLLGIRSILIPNHINHLKYYYDKKLNEEDLFTYQTISSFINNSIETDKSEYWKIGYETLGPLLYGFSKWLISSMQEMEIKKVFFMSRDGLFMQKAFDLMNHTNIQSKYLYASRRALIVPLLWTHPELKDVLKSMNIEKRISVENLVKKLGLNVHHYISQINKFGLEPSTMLIRNSMLDNQDFVKFL